MSYHFTRIATRYAKEVSKSGAFEGRPCGQLEILACRRFLDDLQWQTSGDFEYQYFAPAAESVCEFIEDMPHPKGKWMRIGDGLLDLEPWQIFIVCNVFGWFHKKTGFRRFTEVYWEVARKNAKTTIMAAIALYMAVADGECSPEVFLGATSERQAKIAFNMTRLMAKKAETKHGFTTHFGINVLMERIDLPDQGILEPLPANPGDGASPSFAGVDEFHEHKNDRLVDAMKTGMGSRDNGLVFEITTAGTNYSGPCWEARDRIVRMLEGQIEQPNVFGIIFAADKEDDWHNFENWKKANPNYGVSVGEAYLRKQLATAIASARKRNSILTKNYNLWCHALDGYFDMPAWVASDIKITQDVSEEELVTARCSAAVDLAYKRDLVSVTLMFEIQRDEGPVYYIIQKFFLPSAAANSEDNAHYQDYQAKGEITVTDGEITDFGAVENYIVAASKKYEMEILYYDTFGAVQLATRLESKHSIEVCEFLQRAKYTTEPMRWFEAHIKAGNVRHEGNQCLTWCIGNVRAKDYGDKGVLPRKGPDETQKIDGAATCIMAMTHFCDGEEEKNWYEDNDLVVVG